jgi:hypothetical protein
MRWQPLGFRTLFVVAVAAAIGLWPSAAPAQNNQNNNNTNGVVSGIEVDAQGVVRRRMVVDVGGMTARERIAAQRAMSTRDVLAPSKLRKVSLTRLEKAILQKSGVLSEEMRFLAGLQRVRYVFYYPETKDIVIAGPAEGWVMDGAGHALGVQSGRPALQLQDLVVALRAFPPGSAGAEMIGCSIDPTPEGLAAMQQFLRSMGSNFAAGQEQVIAPRIVEGLRSSLGMQNVTVNGVSPKTHFAQVLVEADYRMKLIGIGLEQPPIRMVSFVDRVNPSQVARNALFRWFFIPDYNCVRVSEDGLAMELVGDGVKLVGEDEMIAEGGRRAVSGRSNMASQAFVTSFTQKYPMLAERSPVYAELRNLIDLAVAAAFVQKQDYYGKADWKMEFFGNEEAMPTEVFNPPKQVESTVATVWRGSRLMTPIAGGVRIEPLMAVKPENVLADENGNLPKLHNSAKLKLAPGQWWWD